MADNAFIKAERVVRTALGMLEREITLTGLVWRDAGGSFKGAKDDTISIRVPSFVNARTRALRGGRPITLDNLEETKVDLTLDTDVYKAVAVTDEEMTLDIEDFGAQVLDPIVHSVARGVEDSLGDTMVDADYKVELDIDDDDPYLALVDARTALNDARVPRSNRFLAVGSAVEAAILKSDRLSKFDSTGDSGNSALRDALIGRIAGFTAIGNDSLEPGVAIAAHQTAFVLSMQAPIVPDGVTWGESVSWAGLAMRAIKDYDFLNVQDRVLVDVFVGSNAVLDPGNIGLDGKFVPDNDADPIFVRAVKLSLPGVTSA